MKGLITFLCICQTVFGSQLTSPVLAWSNINYFTGRNLQINEIVSTNLFNRGSRYVDDEKKPEVIFIFAEPELRTEQLSLLTHSHSVNPNGGALGNLKALIESYSTSSITLPYTSSDNGKIASTIVDNIVNKYETSSITVSDQESRNKMLKDITYGQWDILKNGKTEVVYVTFQSPSVHGDGASVIENYKADDEFIMQVHNALKSQSVPYAAAFTSQQTGLEKHLQSQRALNAARASVIYADVKEDGSIYWPSIVNEVILLMAPLLLILVIGICCTAQIQSAYKYEVPDKKKQ
eukprot:TRINITY_DN69_c0_g1_i1.p1 TRINITY_DN69_c0_g1~~TRINITY_DN69_c0_g1_i1.p1  ORF type:complete len:313 (-),score=80.49 TRINITY_DN69_c0_g1_i1:156-1034(-)